MTVTQESSLRDKIPILIQYINQQGEVLNYNERIYNILEGNLLPELLQALRNQLSDKAYIEAQGRSAPINVLRRIVNKLSRIYSEPAGRTPVPDDETDSELISWVVTKSKLDAIIQEANEYFNASKAVAIQPFYVKNKEGFRVPRVRVLPPHLFLPFSDDPVDPLNMTVFIKIGKVIYYYDKDKNPIPKKTYDIYSDTEYLPIDEDGTIIEERLEGNGGVNPFGVIPFVYINRSRQELIPQPDTDILAMTLLVPILLTDLNFAVKFMSHAIIYGIDIVPGKLEMNPNAFWLVKSEEREGSKPEIGALKPDVDIDKVLTLIKEQISLWLESRNIKPGKGSMGSVESASSGIALLIEESDTTEDRKVQVNYFRAAEERLWELIKIEHNYYADEMKEKLRFNDDMEVSISFNDQAVIEDRNTKIDRISKELDKKLTSRHAAISELNPEMSSEEIDEYIKEIDEENTLTIKEGGNNGLPNKDKETSEEDSEETGNEGEEADQKMNDKEA